MMHTYTYKRKVLARHKLGNHCSYPPPCAAPVRQTFHAHPFAKTAIGPTVVVSDHSNVFSMR